jgi:hypothetical protein
MKLYIKYIIIGLLVSLFLPPAFLKAQSPEENEEKYWNYRNKLRNDFMIGIGPDMGQSIPASVRDTVSGALQWTDCTIAFGQYIGILAMEYRILDDASLSTAATVEELFYALWAMNRLDYHAESFFGGTPSLNGFFIRDDISEDSLDMEAVLAHLNQGLAEPKISYLISDYMNIEPRNNEESIDQAILLITGLGLVVRCVPTEVVYTKNFQVQEFQDFETSLSREAENIITRIVNYMKEGDSVTVHPEPDDPNLYGIQGEAWDFYIKNPVTQIEVLRGANAFLLSKGFTSAKYHFTRIESLTTDTMMEMVADTFFLILEDFIVPNDQDFKVINLNAMANYWPHGLQLDTTYTNYNAQVLGPRSKSQSYEWIPMLQQLVFGGTKNYLMSAFPPDTMFYDDPMAYYEYLINLAPAEGPYNYGNGNYPNWEWSSTSRSIQPGRRGETNNGFPGNYDGLDYMLYYNMYRLLFSDPVMISEAENMDIKIYPNPFSDFLNIETETAGAFFYMIHSIEGRMLQKGQLQGGMIRTSSLHDGIYILTITDNKSFSVNKKLIKHKF